MQCMGGKFSISQSGTAFLVEILKEGKEATRK